MVFRILATLAIFFALPVTADEKRFTLAVAPVLQETGALKHILPRFSLKTGVRVTTVGPEEAAEASLGDKGAAAFVAKADGRVFRISVAEGASHALRFRDWLLSDAGKRAVEGFQIEGAQVFARAEGVAEVEVAVASDGDADLGSKLALQRCGRCHVIDKRNRFGGIGSTPSFGAMKNFTDWRERFEAFWTLNPHPSFTQIEDVTEPFDPTRPPPIAPLELTLDEVEAIVAFVNGMERKDLGGALIPK